MQLVKLERAHHAGLKRALGVPDQTSTNQLYAEVHYLPIAVMANLLAQLQLARLHLTELGQRILR